MEALLAVDTVVILVVGVLLVSVLRGYGEVLIQLGEKGTAASSGLKTALPHRLGGTDDPEPAHDLTGVTPEGSAVQISLQQGAPDSLLLFLSSGCLVCRDFFKAVGSDGGDPALRQLRPVIITKGPEDESPSKIASLAVDGSSVPIVMSSEMWEKYEVPGSPFFSLVDGRRGLIVGEGSAPSWTQLESLLKDAIADADVIAPTDARPTVRSPIPSGAARQQALDEALSAAGIGPGHPSLRYADDSQQS